MSSPLHKLETPNWRFSGNGSAEIVSSWTNKIMKKKLGYFVVKATQPLDVP